MEGVISEKDIETLYRYWLEEKAKYEDRAFRYPKNFQKNKSMWSIFTKLAGFLDGSVVNPRHYIRACIHGINNCKPGHLVSMKGIEAYEKYHNLEYEKTTTPIKEIDLSLTWLVEYCRDQEITFGEYPFYQKGKTRVFMIHLETGILSPYLIVLHPNYLSIMESLNDQEKMLVWKKIESAWHAVRARPEIYKKIHSSLNALVDIVFDKEIHEGTKTTNKGN